MSIPFHRDTVVQSALRADHGSSESWPLSLDHRFGGPEGDEGWKISTRRAFLPSQHFAADVRARVAAALRDPRHGGITISEHDGGESVCVVVVAAPDPGGSMPVLAVALRDDWLDRKRSLLALSAAMPFFHGMAYRLGGDESLSYLSRQEVDQGTLNALTFRHVGAGRWVRSP